VPLPKQVLGKPKAIKCTVIELQLGVFGDRPIDLPFASKRGSQRNNQKNQ
jgi:hypothetical protein